MPLPGIRAAKSFLDELQRDLLEIEDQDFDGFFDRWSALGVPEIEEYRGERRRSRGELISEVNRTRRAIEKRPELLREEEAGETPILTGTRRIARGADVLEGLMGNAGNGAPALIPANATNAAPLSTPGFTRVSAPELSLQPENFEAETGGTADFDDGFAAEPNDASSIPEDRAENDGTTDAAPGLSEDEKRNKCQYLQLQIIFWQKQKVAQSDERWRVEDKINALIELKKKRIQENMESVPIIGPTFGTGKSKDGGGSIGKKIGKGVLSAGKKAVGVLPDILSIQKKKESIHEIDEQIFAREWERDGIKFELAATEKLIADATKEFDDIPCEWDLSLGIAG